MTDPRKMCGWGILSTASIARKNWPAIVNSGNGRLVAVASRLVESAQRFIDENQASAPAPYRVEAVEGYHALLERSDIDALYIPLPTALRSEWAIKAAEAGKHILIEKPAGVMARDLERIVCATKKNGVQLMDGTMFMHSSRILALRPVLNDEDGIGEVRRVTSHFSHQSDKNWLLKNSTIEPAGCLGDLGWYNIRVTLFAMRDRLPVEVRGRILKGIDRPDGSGVTPIEFAGEMYFENGASAVMYNGFNANREQWAYITGANGPIHIKDFVLPHFGNEVRFTIGRDKLVRSGCAFNFERHNREISLPEYSNNHPTAQETNMFRAFGELALSGKPDPSWPDMTMKTQRVLDALLASANSAGEPVRQL